MYLNVIINAFIATLKKDWEISYDVPGRVDEDF